MTELTWLDPINPQQPFPPVERALEDPNGLLAAGGGLEPERLLNAYKHGIFPWYEDGQPILWWSPDPRAIFDSREIRISRSLKKTLRNKDFTVSFDKAFEQVIRACAEPRDYASGTWITEDMIQAYIRLHRLGHARSVEVWNKEGKLVGGLYGIQLNTLFCGESMFSRERDMSKVALVFLAHRLQERGIFTIDCQLPNDHLLSLGAKPVPRDEFIQRYLNAEK